ncbi:MAG: hypothetical protein Q8O40_03385 [Chloroflexota bacterium]|nr:hypothetical protein [Chloroflexota bacterium]
MFYSQVKPILSAEFPTRRSERQKLQNDLGRPAYAAEQLAPLVQALYSRSAPSLGAAVVEHTMTALNYLNEIRTVCAKVRQTLGDYSSPGEAGAATTQGLEALERYASTMDRVTEELMATCGITPEEANYKPRGDHQQ